MDPVSPDESWQVKLSKCMWSSIVLLVKRRVYSLGRFNELFLFIATSITPFCSSCWKTDWACLRNHPVMLRASQIIFKMKKWLWANHFPSSLNVIIWQITRSHLWPSISLLILSFSDYLQEKEIAVMVLVWSVESRAKENQIRCPWEVIQVSTRERKDGTDLRGSLAL